MDEHARRGFEKEQSRWYFLDEDSDFEDHDEDKEPEGQGLPRQVRHICQARDVKHALDRRQPISSR